MAEQIAFGMSAGFMSFFFTVFAAGVRQGHIGIAWFLVPATIAPVSRQVVLGIAVIAVWTGPSVKSTD